MKQNKRLFLVTLALLLAALLCTGIAWAEEAVAVEAKPITGITFKAPKEPIKLVNDLSSTLSISTRTDADIPFTITPADADLNGYELKWNIDKKDVHIYSSVTLEDYLLSAETAGKVTVAASLYQNGNYIMDCAPFTVEFVEVPVTDVKQTKTEIETTVDGDPIEFATYLFDTVPDEATYHGVDAFNWTIDDRTIADLQVGTYDVWLYAKKPGTVTVTATEKVEGKLIKTFKVTVKEPVAYTSISLNPATLKMVEGEGYSLECKTEPDDATDKLLFVSDNLSVATVNESGSIYAWKAGEATITATSALNPAITATCKVTVVEDASITSLKFTQKQIELSLSDYSSVAVLNNYLAVSPLKPSNRINWTVSDPTIIKITELFDESAGEYKAYLSTQGKVGKTTVTAASSKDPTISDTVEVVVTAQNATSVAFTSSTLELEQGSGRRTLGELIQPTPADAVCKSLTFSTSDRDIVELYDVAEEEYGAPDYGAGYHLEPKKIGTSTITLTWKNYDGTVVSSTMVVTVVAPKIESFSFGSKTEFNLKTSDKGLDLNRRLVIKPDNRQWQAVFADDPDIFIWDSSDASVATVDEYGYVCPVSVGTTTISATYAYDESIKAEVKVNVTGIPVKKIALNRTEIEFNPGKTIKSGKLKLSIQPANADIKEIYWKNSNQKVAFIDTSRDYPAEEIAEANDTAGTLLDAKEIYVHTTGRVGKTVIRVYVDDGVTVHQAKCEVSVAFAAKLYKLEKSKVTLSLTKKKSTNTYYFDTWNSLYISDASETDTYNLPANVMTWTSSKPKIAKVDRNGKITVLKEGKTVITGTSKDGNKTKVKCTVTVKKNDIKSITAINKTLRIGDVRDIDEFIRWKPTETALVRIYDKTLVAKSSDPKVVSVRNGELSAMGEGQAIITVKTKDGKKSVKFIVKVVKDILRDE